MSENAEKITTGGTANVAYISESEGIAAMTGALKGGHLRPRHQRTT